MDKRVLEERLARIDPRPAQNKNCIGTALYLLGYIDEDVGYSTIFHESIEEFLKKCMSVNNLAVADLVVFAYLWNNVAAHMAVVRDQNTGILCHREGFDHPFVNSITMEGLEVQGYSSRDYMIKFYQLPSGLRFEVEESKTHLSTVAAPCK